jgi:DNA repair exonuclease SbcCD ATPase subunit
MYHTALVMYRVQAYVCISGSVLIALALFTYMHSCLQLLAQCQTFDCLALTLHCICIFACVHGLRQCAASAQRNTKLEAAAAADKQALAALRSEVDSLREQCDTLQQQLQTVTSDNGQLAMELTTARSETAIAQQQAAAAAAAAVAAQASYTDVQCACNAIFACK